MDSIDSFSKQYKEVIAGDYKSIDRMVINGYSDLLHNAGGLRHWWRNMYGDDKNLTTDRLMRLSSRYHRSVKSWCASSNIPFISFKAGERKSEKAKLLQPKSANFEGIYAVFVARSTALLWKVRRCNNKIMDIGRKKTSSLVNHFYFHIMDKQWGHVTIKICTHPPFAAQVIVNGHEWLVRHEEITPLKIQKQDNCFINYTEASGQALTAVADTLAYKGQLEKLCDHWLRICIGFLFSEQDQQRSGLNYKCTLFQLELCKNFLFLRGRVLDEIYRRIIDLTRSQVDLKRLRTIFGRKRRPYIYRCAEQNNSRGLAPQVCIQTPDYNLTVFKIHCREFTLKLYDKGERTLRAEVILHNAKKLRCRRSLDNLGAIVNKLEDVLRNFLDNINCMHVSMVQGIDLNEMAIPTRNEQFNIAGINIASPRLQDVMQTVLALSFQPNGYSASEVTERMQKIGWPLYQPHQAAYDIRKLRGKGFVKRHGGRKYRNTSQGTQTMIAILALIQNEFPATMSIINQDKPIDKNDISELEQKHLELANSVSNLKQAYAVRQKAA